MKKMISEISSVLSQKITINPNDICICGFSGGQDSILLFIILLHLKKQWNLKIKLLHFHHFWQQKNFFSTQQVWKLSFVFKSPVYIVTSEEFLDTEKKARQWRQQGFERVSSLEKCTKVLTGHTASDRLETALWHLIRGTSPQGLISLKWQTTLLVQTQFFNFSKFFLFNKKENFLSILDTTILSTCFEKHSFSKQKVLTNNKSKIAKFHYKKYKNKKIIKNGLFFKKTMFFEKLALSKNSVFENGKTSFKNKKTDEFLINKKYLNKYEISSISLKKIKKNFLTFFKKPSLSSFQISKSLFEKQINVVDLKRTKNKLNQQKFKTTIYRNIQNISFFIFKCSLFRTCSFVFPKTPFLEPTQHTTYSFLIFNFVCSEKNILRPMLLLHRNDITFFSKKNKLPILSDPTNQKLCWSRNRIRHQLFPLLKFFYNPNVEYILNNFLEISIEEQKYIESIIQKILNYWLFQNTHFKQPKFISSNELYSFENNENVYFEKKKYQTYNDINNQLQLFPKAIQRRLLQKLFLSYRNLQPNLIQIEILRINSNKNF